MMPGRRSGSGLGAGAAAGAMRRGPGGCVAAPGRATPGGNIAVSAAKGSTTPQPSLGSRPDVAGRSAVKVSRVTIWSAERPGR